MRTVLLILAFLAAFPADAQTVTVRSGDHATFARLVLTIPPGTDWSLGRQGEGYAVALDPDLTFDLSQAFDRIPRNRLVSISDLGAGRIALALGCDCHAQGFLFRPDLLVVDIVDGPAPPGSAFEAALDGTRPTTATEAAPFRLPLLTGLATESPDPLAVPLPGLPADPEDALQTALRVREAEQALVEGLARAASQGLIELAPSPGPMAGPDTAAPEPRDLPQPDPQPAAAPDPAGDAALPSGDVPLSLSDFSTLLPTVPGLATQSVFDRDNPTRAREPVSPDGSACLSDDLLAVADWSGPESFQIEIGKRMTALTSELDTFPTGAVESLARAYIHYGFGQEALRTLAVDGSRSVERDLLGDLARLVDGDPAASTLLDDQGGCTTAVALWVALDRGTLSGTSDAERTAIEMAHRALPDPIRGHIGARLAQMFVDFGDTQAADHILNGTRDTPTADTPEADLARAAIVHETEGQDSAIAQLTDATGPETRPDPAAIVALIDQSLDQGLAIAPETVSLAETLRFEQRGTPLESELARVVISAEIAAGNLDSALSRLGERPDPVDPSVLGALRTDLVLGLVADLSDSAFLAIAFEGLPPDLSPRAENAVAERLIRIGFPDAALPFLASPVMGEERSDRMVLRAQAALALADRIAFDAAVAELPEGLAEDLRLDAARVFGPTESPGSGAAVLPSPPDLTGAVGASDLSLPLLDRDAPIAFGRDLIAQSADARTRAAALLDGSLDPGAQDPAEEVQR